MGWTVRMERVKWRRKSEIDDGGEWKGYAVGPRVVFVLIKHVVRAVALIDAQATERYGWAYFAVCPNRL